MAPQSESETTSVVRPEDEDRQEVRSSRKRQRDAAEELDGFSSNELEVPSTSFPSPHKRSRDLASCSTFDNSVLVTPEAPTTPKTMIHVSTEQVSETKRIQVPSHSDLYGTESDHNLGMPSLCPIQNKMSGRLRRRCSVTKFSLQASKKTLSVFQAAQKALDLIQQEDGEGRFSNH